MILAQLALIFEMSDFDSVKKILKPKKNLLQIEARAEFSPKRPIL